MEKWRRGDFERGRTGEMKSAKCKMENGWKKEKWTKEKGIRNKG